jgi:hypothetical protein
MSYEAKTPLTYRIQVEWIGGSYLIGKVYYSKRQALYALRKMNLTKQPENHLLWLLTFAGKDDTDRCGKQRIYLT